MTLLSSLSLSPVPFFLTFPSFCGSLGSGGLVFGLRLRVRTYFYSHPALSGKGGTDGVGYVVECGVV